MKRITYTLVALVVLLSGYVVGQTQPVQDAIAQVGGGVGNYDIAGNVLVHGNVTVADNYDLTVTDDLNITGDTAFTGPLALTGDLTQGATSDVIYTRATTVTVTTDGTITPAGRYQPLSAAGAVQTSSIAGCNTANDGRIVTLIEGANQTITITDTGTLKLGGNFAMGQYDALTLICDSVNWVEVSRSNN